jgi:hypothetical protein
MALVFYVFSTQNTSIVLYAPENNRRRLRKFFFVGHGKSIVFHLIFEPTSLRKAKNLSEIHQKFRIFVWKRFRALVSERNERIKGKLRNAIGNRVFNAIQNA